MKRTPFSLDKRSICNLLHSSFIFKSGAGRYPINIEEVTLGNALFHTKTNTSWLFVGQPVQICLRGTYTQDFPNGLSNLQNSVHGDVNLLGDVIDVKVPFCDINTVGCPGLRSQTCGSGPINAGDPFCFCSVLKEVPPSPDVSKFCYGNQDSFIHSGKFRVSYYMSPFLTLEKKVKLLLVSG